MCSGSRSPAKKVGKDTNKIKSGGSPRLSGMTKKKKKKRIQRKTSRSSKTTFVPQNVPSTSEKRGQIEEKNKTNKKDEEDLTHFSSTSYSWTGGVG